MFVIFSPSSQSNDLVSPFQSIGSALVIFWLPILGLFWFACNIEKNIFSKFITALGCNADEVFDLVHADEVNLVFRQE